MELEKILKHITIAKDENGIIGLAYIEKTENNEIKIKEFRQLTKMEILRNAWLLDSYIANNMGQNFKLSNGKKFINLKIEDLPKRSE